MPAARTEALLALLQISDSAFPSGAFTHSYGLEMLARERIVRTPPQLEAYVASVLTGSVLTSDAVAAQRAWQAVAGDGKTGKRADRQRRKNVDELIAIDRALLRLKAAPELRQAALATGRRLIDETAPHLGRGSDESRPYKAGARVDVLQEYAARLEDHPALGLHPVAFGAVSATLGVALEDVAPALLQSTANALLQAGMRLLPISHRDVQAILHRLRPVIASLTSESDSDSEPTLSASGEGRPAQPAGEGSLCSPSPLAERGIRGDEVSLSCFHPLQEIASLRHARAEARLFAS